MNNEKNKVFAIAMFALFAIVMITSNYSMAKSKESGSGGDSSSGGTMEEAIMAVIIRVVTAETKKAMTKKAMTKVLKITIMVEVIEMEENLKNIKV